MDAVEQIKARLAIEDVIGETVVLKPAGKDRLKGLCPFHAEKTPSFHVVTDKGYYYCFSCHAKGDLFSFVQNTQNLDFRAALELLAERAGVELPKRTERESKKRDLYDLNNLAQEFFVAKLAEHPEVRDYLAGRGFAAETVDAWGLGYAPEGWTNLTQHARTRGVELEALEKAGLAKNKDGRFYDLFRHRVTIPIRDPFGRVVGFSARALVEGDKTPKYVNTPETAAFKKGELLFGLDRAKAAIRESHAAILVEGQLDVVALHQAGFTAAVGAQSATLTDAQITALERLGVTTLYLAFDSDEAGQRATLAGCEAVARRFVVKVVRLPHKDPAETVGEDPGLFRQVLGEALPEPHYRVMRACEGVNPRTPHGQATVLKRLKGAMLGRNPTDPVAAEVQEWVIRELGLPLDRLNAWLGDPRAALPSPPEAVQVTKADMVRALRVKIAALVLSYGSQLESSCARLRTALPEGDPLVVFADRCADAAYDATTIYQRLPTWEEVEGVLEHVIRGFSVPLARLECELLRYAKLTGVAQQLRPGLETASNLTQNPSNETDDVKAPQTGNSKTDVSEATLDSWIETLKSWLKTGQLDDLGSQKLRVVRAKLEQQDRAWLYRLILSREVYGLVKPHGQEVRRVV